MPRAENLQQELLLFESPMASEQERAAQAWRVCREARKLLREDYGLDGDFPADAAVEPDRSERRQRVLAAVRDFYRGNVQTQPGTVKGHSARPAPELFKELPTNE